MILEKIILLTGIIIFVFLLVSTASFAGGQGNATQLEQGIYGTDISARYCTTNADCGTDYICFQEHDGVSSGTNTGSCYPKWETFCVNNATFTANGGTVCRNSTTVLTCSSGTWGASSCATLHSCKAATNTCTADAAGGCTSNCGGGTGNGASNDTATSSLSITTYPSDFDIVQNTTASKVFVVENDGETNLSSLSLSIAGVDALVLTVTPSGFESIRISETKTFAVDFAAPESAAIGVYTVTATASASAVTDSVSFTVSILPSNETIENIILPGYQNYSSIIPGMESLINSLAAQGKNTTEVQELFNQFKAKVTEAGEKIQSSDFLAATQLLNEAGQILESIKAKIEELGAEGIGIDFGPYTYIIVVVIVVAAIGIVVYKFMPRKSRSFFAGKDEVKEEPKETGQELKKR